MNHYQDKAITWQAHSVMMVNVDCIRKGKYPNGKKLDAKAKRELEQEIENCIAVLRGNFIQVEQRNKQLELFV